MEATPFVGLSLDGEVVVGMLCGEQAPKCWTMTADEAERFGAMLKEATLIAEYKEKHRKEDDE